MRLAFALAFAACATAPFGDGSDGAAQGNKAAVGDPCASGADCATGECLTDLQSKLFFGGYCTLFDCDTRNLACPTGSACKPGGDGHQYCLKDCNPQATTPPCRNGYGCCAPGPLGMTGWCAPTVSPLCTSF
jgi:hypothetical protein